MTIFITTRGAWVMTKTNENKLATTFDYNILRRIYLSKRNIEGEDEIRTNQEIEKLVWRCWVGYKIETRYKIGKRSS